MQSTSMLKVPDAVHFFERFRAGQQYPLPELSGGFS